MDEKKEENKVIDLARYVDYITRESDDDYYEKAYDFTRDGEQGAGSGIWESEIKAITDMQTIEGTFFSEDWVYIVVDLVSQKISSQPLAIMSKKVVDGSEVYEFADNHPLNKIIDNPNSFQSYNSWMYLYVCQYTLMGNAINWYSESLDQIFTLRTSQIQLNFNDRNEIVNYQMVEQSEDYPLDPSERKIMTFDPTSIIHTRRPNPASIVWGLSPFVPGRKSVLFNRYSSDYLNSFYLKQAVPGMILEVENNMNETVMLRQLRTFEMAYTGRNNQRRTMILPKGVKATPSTVTIADQELISLINNNREVILALLKVPKHEVGLQESGSLGSEEYKIAIRNFWEATLIPTMRMIESSLTSFFKKKLGDKYFFKFDISNVEALKDDLLAKATLAKEMLQAGLSVNEVRKKIWEVKESDAQDSDVPFVLRNDNQFGQFQQFGQEVESVDDVEEKSMLSIETKEVETDEDKLKSLMELRKKGWVDQITKQFDEVLESDESKTIEEVALMTLTAMGESALPIVKRNLREVKDVEVSSRKKLRKELEKAFDEFELDYTNEYVNSLKSVMELGYDQQLELVLDSQDIDKIEALRDKTEEKRNTILEARGLESFAFISQTHTDRIMKQILDGAEKGESIGAIIERIQETFADLGFMKSRAETIARTETLTAVSVGQAALLQNAASVIKGLKKAWLNAGDSRVRDQHLDKSNGGVSGEIVDADREFSNGLRWPRDLKSNDPAQVINCRCTLITLLPGEDL